MMSNQQVPADAGGMPITRRAILGTGTTFLVAGAAGMVASQTMPAEVPVPESAELYRLIEASRRAEAAWIRASDHADESSGHPENRALEEEATRLAVAADIPLLALLAYRVADLGELRMMVTYLLSPGGPWDGEVRIERDHVLVLLNAIMAGGGR